MNIQQLQSQINIITARIEQIKNSGYFTVAEIEKYTSTEEIKLQQLKSQIDTLKAKDIEVIVEPDTL